MYGAEWGKKWSIQDTRLYLSLLIIIPEEDKTDIEDLKNMVQEVNETQLLTEEILSNHIYYYNSQRDEVMMY